MPLESWVAVLACGAAVLALVVAVMAVRSMRRLRDEVRSMRADGGRQDGGRQNSGRQNGGRHDGAVPQPATDGSGRPGDALVYSPTPLPVAGARPPQVMPRGRAVVTQEGTVIVLPSEEQVVAATMGRPLIRGAVLSHGLLYALRPESRDRIRGMVRREFRRRRKLRRRAARQAARSAPVGTPPQAWLGTGGSSTHEQEGER